MSRFKVLLEDGLAGVASLTNITLMRSAFKMGVNMVIELANRAEALEA
jgi:hypothetical protein